MIKGVKAFLAGATVLAATSFGAAATDLYGRGGMKDSYVPVAQASPASWYIRGQVGYGWHHQPQITEYDPNPGGCCGYPIGTFDLHSTSIHGTWSAGLGVGRYLARNWRVDLTWDHRFETEVRGQAGLAPGGVPTFPGIRSFGLRSDVFLVNAYYDFDMGRFRPYIGLGIGASHNVTTGGEVTSPCGTCVATIEGAKQWSVAGALMTGVSLQLRDRVHFDAGYRYLFIGDAHTGLIVGATANSGDPKVHDISAHEIRVGLRFDIR